jgi:hypothetical protein
MPGTNGHLGTRPAAIASGLRYPLPQPPDQRIPRSAQGRPQQMAMTIAIGILAADGYVVGADTRITQGPWKTELGKVGGHLRWSLEHGEGACVVTGAGNHTHIADLAKTLGEVFATNETVSDRSVIEKLIKKAVREFYKLPGADADIVFAYQRNHRYGMWSSSGAVIAPRTKYAAVGTGASYAYTLLGRLCEAFPPIADVRETVGLASYVLRQVKDSIDGCGGAHTDIAFVRNHSYVQVERSVTRALDDVFGEYLERREPHMLHGICGGDTGPHESGSALQSLRAKVAEITAQIPELADNSAE